MTEQMELRLRLYFCDLSLVFHLFCITNHRIRLSSESKKEVGPGTYLFLLFRYILGHLTFLCNRRINGKEIKYLPSACEVFGTHLGQVLPLTNFNRCKSQD